MTHSSIRLLAGATLAATLAAIFVVAESGPPAPGAAGDEKLAAVTSPGEAPQRRRGFGGFGRYSSVGSSTDLPVNEIPYAGKFTFLRLRFDEAYTSPSRAYEFGIDQGWNHDYPRAEYNLSLMLDELTSIEVTVDYRGGNIFSFTDPQLYNYPFVYISEPGYWVPSEEEIKGIGEYLLKGGFIMVDDMESDDTDAFYRIMQEAIPGTEFVILDTTHPIFNCFFEISQEDIFNQYYRSRYGNPVIFGVYEDNDPSKRLLAVVNHNQDIGESWEFSNTGYVPPDQANNSYKIGMNYVICSMLH
jgi:hypothetical protein